MIRLSLDIHIPLYRWNQIDLSLITWTVTLKTSFTWYNATTTLNSTSLKTVSTNTADQLTILLISLNPTLSQNIFLLMITALKTLHLFHYNSLNLIETVYEKLEKHTSLKEAKLLKHQVLTRKMKCNTFPSSSICIYLYDFYISSSFHIPATSTVFVFIYF